MITKIIDLFKKKEYVNWNVFLQLDKDANFIEEKLTPLNSFMGDPK